MAQELVRVALGDVEKNVGRNYAEKNNLKILDEPLVREDGRKIGTTRRGGRPAKPKTTVAKQAAAKKAATKTAESNPPSGKEN